MEHNRYKRYKELLGKRRAWYKNIKKVYCPCLKTDVLFNSRGFYHLRYDGSGRERTIDEQIVRLNLLPLVIPAIKQAKEIKEYRRSKNGNTEYWALQENVGKHKVKIRVVLIRESKGGVIYFSVMKKRKQKDHH